MRPRREEGAATRLALGALATWRVTHLLADEDGPADVVVRVRAGLGEGSLGRLMDCFACLSVWVAAPIAAATARGPRDIPLQWLALSGAACLLERATQDPLRDGAGVWAAGDAAREHPRS